MGTTAIAKTPSTLAVNEMIVYSDESSEYPCVGILNDPEEGLIVVSFESEEEARAWGRSEEDHPENMEPIEPEDADDMVAELTPLFDGIRS